MIWHLLGELVGPNLVEQLLKALLSPIETKGRVIAASIVAKFLPHAKTTLLLIATIANTAAVLAKLCAAFGLQISLVKQNVNLNYCHWWALQAYFTRWW